jgi:hypothetical protein
MKKPFCGAAYSIDFDGGPQRRLEKGRGSRPNASSRTNQRIGDATEL